jgi:two-component system chemotaxis response regulator CheB
MQYRAVIIGASAGGLFAVSDILEQLPGNYPIPIVVVQHRLKDQRDLLEQVLQSKCLIKVKQADEKEKIRGGLVYIAPPDYHLLIEEDETFSLTTDMPVRFSRPSIDVLFETAAHAFGKTLIAIILTGASSDGAAGMIEIKKHGGLTIAQDPAEAEFSFMPEASIRTNAINYVWKIPEIKQFLLKTIVA